MVITKKHIPRRTVLRGAGVAMALPLLDSMIPALGASAAPAGGHPRRLGCVYVPNGISMGFWTPSSEGRGYALTPTLQPLAPFRDHVTVISGLRNHVAEARPGEGPGDHSRGQGCHLTGVHIKRTEGAVEAGVSMDQIAARAFEQETQLASLEVALESVEFLGACDNGYSCAYSGTISWRNPTTPLPMENNPRAVFERLFGDGGSTDRQSRISHIHRSRSILDAVTGEASSLGGRIGPGDRAKLTQYLDAIRDAERRLQKAEEQDQRELPAIDAPTGGIPTSYAEHYKLMADLITFALQADLTRVFTMMCGKELSGRAFPEIGVPEGHHGVSHHQQVPERLAKLAKIDTFNVQLFAYLLARLRSTADGDGTLLDHTVILYGSGLSDGDRHSHDDLPILLAGGAGGRLKGGRHLRYPDDTPLTNLHLTLLDMVGVPAERIGDSTGVFRELSGV